MNCVHLVFNFLFLTRCQTYKDFARHSISSLSLTSQPYMLRHAVRTLVLQLEYEQVKIQIC